VSSCATLIIVLGANAHFAQAETPIRCAPQEGVEGKVIKVAGPLDLVLDNGTEIALSEIGAPAPNKDRPWADIASGMLSREALGKTVRLYFDGAEQDRHGRALAQVFIDGAQEPWLQRALVQAGAAYVDTWPTNRACAADLLKEETEARGAGRGIWSDPSNAVLDADNAGQAEGRFAIVQGKVESVTRLSSPSRIYIDFGPDWHTDFTIRIEAKAVHLFKTENIDPRDWEGTNIRVRGYTGWRFGPEIEVMNPEQIEVLRPVRSN